MAWPARRSSRMTDKHPTFPEKDKYREIKKDLIATMGEFIATILFLLFGLGGVQVVGTSLLAERDALGADASGTSPNGSDAARLLGYYYISSTFGFSLFAIASIFYRFTGSIMNPSVGLALCLCGVIKPLRFVLTATAQMVGAIVAAAILDGLTPGPLNVGVALGYGTNRTRGLFIEMFTTATLVMSVLMLAAEKHNLTPLAPLGFGFTLFIVMLWSVPFTGGAVNTARAFGPAVIEGFPDYHWIYWLGPTLGALLSSGLFYILKRIHYWKVNPNQDSTDPHDAPSTGERDSSEAAV